MSLNDQALAGAAGVLKNDTVVAASMCRRFSVQDRVISQFAGMQKLALRMEVGSADSMGMNQNLPVHLLFGIDPVSQQVVDLLGADGRASGGEALESPVSGAGGFSPPSTGSGRDRDRLDNLARLGDLHASGVLTDAEFDAQKAAILRG